MSAERGGSARDIFDTKAMLAFAQMLLAAPDGGIRVILPELDDMQFHVVCSVYGAHARPRVRACDSSTRVCDSLSWTIEGHVFEAHGPWREPTLRDLRALRSQEPNHG